ncbi:hypothetical protein BGW38_001556 [Lunasporangiospora selenospora]|uniref:Fe2OG dioxygenase domain-containing protein n=1 Tax=Lunasporangiospora selenospora TaxID=979761 RepID=A0A9P6KJ82_9FUNG|nr:hypothetical protein BGW38_001556 [Lunasporangiospora selenospora]
MTTTEPHPSMGLDSLGVSTSAGSFSTEKEPIRSLPVIDFAHFRTNKELCAQEILQASQDIGFFYLVNHGISQELVDEMFGYSTRYYTKPLSYKTAHIIGRENYGYTGLQDEKLDLAHEEMDMKECFNVTKRSIDDASTKSFTLGDPAAQEKVGDFFKSLHELGLDILRCFAIALKIPEGAGGQSYFDHSHKWEAPAFTTLRFLHYPQQKGDPRQPLAGSHSDYGTITLLFQKDIPGLEVQASRTHPDVPWVPAPVIPGAILINIADHFQIWTNGLVKSTKHRVMYNPLQETSSRYSIACFMNANNDIRLEPIPSPMITQEMRDEAVEFEEGRNMTAGEYMKWRFALTYKFDELEKTQAKM